MRDAPAAAEPSETEAFARPDLGKGAGGRAGAALREWVGRVRPLLASPRFVIDCLLSGVACYCLGMGFMYWVLEPIYAALPACPVPDRILAALPSIDLNYPSAIALWCLAVFFGVYVLLRLPEKVPFVLKSFAVMGFTKHLMGPLTNFTQPVGAIRDFAYDNIYNDLFFSGHVAMTFFCFLVMRRNSRRAKYVALGVCLFEACAVLLMKLHYSIDVIAAPFIAYGIFKLLNRLLAREKTRYEDLIPDKSRILTIG
jgi:membrane-associated phospholipid phosphatase